MFFFFFFFAPEISYNITLDALRAKARASFEGTDSKSDRRVTRSFSITNQEGKCMNETFVMSVSSLIFLVLAGKINVF